MIHKAGPRSRVLGKGEEKNRKEKGKLTGGDKTGREKRGGRKQKVG